MKMITATLALLVCFAVACNGNDDSDGTPTPSPTNAPTETSDASTTPSLEDEVGAAYLEYWDAYSAALLALEPALVEEFASGQQLQRIQDEIDGLEAQRVAERVVVEHDFVVINATAEAATVLDEIVNNSFFVDPVTKNPPSAAGSGEMFTDTYQMEKVGDRWVVVNGSRSSEGSS